MKVRVLKSDYHFITPGMEGEAEPCKVFNSPSDTDWFEVSFSSVECPVPGYKITGEGTFAFKRDQLEFLPEPAQIAGIPIVTYYPEEVKTPVFLYVEIRHQVALEELCGIINDWAEKKGWNDAPDDLSHKCEQIALMHSELSECLEYLRKKEQPAMDDKVPELTGEAAELADVLIRIFHYCGKRNINLGEAVRLKHQFNITRPYRHGKLS